MKIRVHNSVFNIVLASFLVLVGLVFVNSRPTQAAAVTGFNAGRIMDDAIFTKKSSMSASQIQSFLNSKMSSCDTNGKKTSEWGGGTRAQYGKAHHNPAPFVCLKDYKENPTVTGNSASNWWKNGRTNLPGSTLKTSGAKTAAQIIYQAAQDYSINPQVLIVLLQKEQGLVTDDWPWIYQYRSATGYGCPDNAACATEYYGLYNQVRWSARMFRAILNQSPTWDTPYSLGNNRIYWNPDTGRCGSSTVNIQNLTTVALYSYTPYRPNQAALNAGYGTGDGCSSYGNRNFYQYFKDWFGSPFATYAASISDVQIYTDADRTNRVSSIPTLQSGVKVYITVKAKNTGSYTWEKSFTRIGTTDPHDRSSGFTNDSWLSPIRPAQLSESSVPPGSTGTFNFSMSAPLVDGSYTEKFGVVAEGKQWMSDNPNLIISATVSNPYNASISSVSVYSDPSRTKKTNPRVKTGTTTYWRISAKNIGSHSWSNSIVKLGTTAPNDHSSTLSNDTWVSSNRLALLSQTSVTPGSNGTFDFSLTAPSTEQSVLENFGIVAEGQSWMPNGKLPVRLTGVKNLDILAKNQTLYSLENLTSIKHHLSLQSDGNLVLYNSSGKAIWHTHTNGKGGSRLLLQSDGNLVLYNSSGKAIWHTHTNGK